jgi:hypothetical protein
MSELIMVSAADMAVLNRRLTLEEVLHQPERLGNSPLPRAP